MFKAVWTFSPQKNCWLPRALARKVNLNEISNWNHVFENIPHDFQFEISNLWKCFWSPCWKNIREEISFLSNPFFAPENQVMVWLWRHQISHDTNDFRLFDFGTILQILINIHLGYGVCFNLKDIFLNAPLNMFTIGFTLASSCISEKKQWLFTFRVFFYWSLKVSFCMSLLRETGLPQYILAYYI